METVRAALEKIAEKRGPQEVARIALCALSLEQLRIRRALEDVRQALVEAERLTAGAFGYEEANRAVEMLEKAVHRVRCAANGMRGE